MKITTANRCLTLTFWAKHAAFVEVYGTAKIPKSGIPKFIVTVGWPRLNGRKVANEEDRRPRLSWQTGRWPVQQPGRLSSRAAATF